MSMRYLAKAIESGLNEVFSVQKFPEKTKGMLRSAFLAGFEKELKTGLVQETLEASRPKLQEGRVVAKEGNRIHINTVGDLTIQHLTWQNWLRILFRFPVKNLKMFFSVEKMEFEERVVH